MIDSLSEWSLNVLEVYSLKNRSLPYTYWYDFLRGELNDIPGDVLEFGVFRGRTLATTAYCASLAEIKRKVYGYDSFSGFPPDLDLNDHPDRFDDLLNSGSITQHHYDMVQKNREYLAVTGRSFETSNSSSSGNFSSTSLEFVTNKLNYLGLDILCLSKAKLHISFGTQSTFKIAAIFLDADLFKPYDVVLKNVGIFVPGGIIY